MQPLVFVSLPQNLNESHIFTMYPRNVPESFAGGSHCRRVRDGDFPTMVIPFGGSVPSPGMKMPLRLTPWDVYSGCPLLCVRTLTLTVVQASRFVHVTRVSAE